MLASSGNLGKVRLELFSGQHLNSHTELHSTTNNITTLKSYPIGNQDIKMAIKQQKLETSKGHDFKLVIS